MHEVAGRTADRADLASDADAGAAAAPVPRRRRWWPAALGALLVVLAGVAALLQPTEAVRADVTEHIVLTEPLPAILPGEEESFSVLAQEDGLSRVDVVLATYLDSIECTLVATLEEGDEVLGTSEIPCDSLVDNAANPVVSVDPIEDSAGKTYDVTLSITPGSVVGPSVWDTRGGDAAYITRYGEEAPAVGRIGLVLDRMDDYSGPWGSPVGVALLGLALAGAIVLLVRRPRWGLVAVVALVVVRGLLWTALIPPLQGMDEGAHFANVQFMAEEGRLPNWATEEVRYGPYSQSLKVASEAMNVSAHRPTDRPDYGDDAVEELRERDAEVGVGSDGTAPAASYPPAYYGPAAIAYALAPDDTVEQVHAIRLWSVALGALAIVFAWCFAGELFPGRRAPQALLTVAVALQPMLAHQFAIVNNDAWVIASGFAALWLAARLVRSARAPWVMFGAGVAAGCGALGKPFAAIVVVAVATGWLLGKVRHRVRDVRTYVVEPLLALVGVALTYGTWLVASRVLGVDPGLGFPETPDDGARDLITYLATQYDPALEEARGLWIRQYWGVFGWVNTPLPELMYTVIFWVYVAVAVALVVWVVMVVRQRGRRDEEARRLDAYILLCAVAAASAVGGMYLIEYLFFASSGRTDLLQGRYVLLAAPALLALPVLLAQRFRRAASTATVAAGVLVAGVAVLHLASIGVIAEHFYL
ncbi:DUF2142 domain-containing protein [Cellulomonas sp. zg-ZUI199]|uniref:DUF2142 domain-containing protein n=1 Tax=Cellulomonas wangleii TaxID=2816956 RepID=A0ABX8D166_9CELL|nr:DUF2142 domain-containing protein [Cellulomonas wangleii]MBO0925301.1 DUF2142 domain-containing protein [Cellulomonas wangleii]QVI61200.1 DUF2142 domain-containing protein [Cellulomonas wangleii]